MSKSKKRLSPDQQRQVVMLIDRGVSISSIAKHYKVTKPTILKSLESWNTGIKKAPDGSKYRLRKGKLDIISRPKPKKEDVNKLAT